MPQNYEQINKYEREIIAEMRGNRKGWDAIGARLGRSGSSAWREYHRNQTSGGKYLPGAADKMAEQRRHIPRKPRKIAGEVKKQVEQKLEQYWSPEQVEGRAKLEGYAMACFMTIYNFLETEEGQEYRQYLRGPGKKRKTNKKKHQRIHDRTMIDKRPKEAEERKEPGHCEGDTVRGPMTSGSCILTLTDRLTLYLATAKLDGRKAAYLNEAAEKVAESMPMRTITVDNGMEFASHKELKEKTGADIYFAHPGCPWERGGNENANGLLRQFFPKGTDFDDVSIEELAHATDLINNRPRKKLGYKTSEEVKATFQAGHPT